MRPCVRIPSAGAWLGCAVALHTLGIIRLPNVAALCVWYRPILFLTLISISVPPEAGFPVRAPEPSIIARSQHG